MLWELYEEIAPHEKLHEEVFVEVEGIKGVAPADGFGADYAGGLVIDAVLYIAPEAFGCETDCGNFYYQSYGNEPFWSVVISSQGIDFSRLDGPKPKGHFNAREVRFETAEKAGRKLWGTSGNRHSCRDGLKGNDLKKNIDHELSCSCITFR